MEDVADIASNLLTILVIMQILIQVLTSTAEQIVPLFVKATKSRYRDTFSFRTEVCREDAVGFGLNSSDPAERDIMMEVQDYITKHPDLESNAAFPYNPCNYGYCLCSIKKGK